MDTNKSRIFYLLRGSSDPAVLGNKSGIKQADIRREGFRNPKEYDRLLSDLGSIRYWEIRDSISTLVYDVLHVELFGPSRLTDFLRYGPSLINCRFMISEKVERVLNNYKLFGVSTFPAQVVEKGQKFNYKLCHVQPMPHSMIDFKQSTFYLGLGLGIRKPVIYKCENDLITALDERKGVGIESIGLKPEFTDVDFFSLFNGEIVVSENLRIDLEENGATSGVEFLPAFGVVNWPKIN
jgi:hypothetical protein